MLINGAITPNADLVGEIESLKPGEALVKDSLLIAVCLDEPELDDFDNSAPAGFVQKQSTSTFLRITRPWHLFYHNGQELISDFELITAGKTSMPVSSTNNLIRPDRIFAEEGARLEYATLNASTGPIYLGRNTEIMEGALIRGPFALCEGAIVKMGAKIYGPTTIGPFSKVGGEVTNSVIIAYSNKVHEGYMGNSVIGRMVQYWGRFQYIQSEK